MNLSVNGRIRRSIGVAFAVGVAGAGTTIPAHAQQGATQLQGVEVTGSRIRRVDSETSNLVQVLDRKQIEATGAATLGELVQSIPSITGAPLNASANNNGVSATGGGGSFGGSTAIDIRGLGPKRTLVLIDGQRVNNADPDAIPANMIERIEVLKAGAGSTYGTDAIGGVVNFITRKNFSGMELNGQFGETEKGDGAASGASATWGSTGSKGSAVFGINFNKQNGIKATDRKETALPASFDEPYGWSSSRAPGGKFAGVGPGGCAATLTPGATGTSASDYTCFNNSRKDLANTTRFNFQPYNLDLDPTLHESLFGTGTYRLTDEIKWYGQGYFTHAFSQRQLAPEPFDNGTIEGIIAPPPTPVISSQNIYNPFGADITSFAKRSTDAGGRVFDYNVDQWQGTTGLKGTLLDRFDWDLAYSYGRLDTSNIQKGFLNFAQVFQQLGPSFYRDPVTGADVTTRTPGHAATGPAGSIPTCGTPGNIIPNCTPLDVFGHSNANLGTLTGPVNDVTVQDLNELTFNINGDLFKLPAGMVAGSVGFEYRSTHLAFTPDVLQQEFKLSESNQQSTNGGYNAREYYAEVQVPVLANLPGAKSLSFNLGGRYSDFSSFGSHTTGKYAMEYRPYNDLMLRATYADTFRAPNVSELFGGAAQSSPVYSDPCTGLTTADVAKHPKACNGVVGGTLQPDGSITGAASQPDAQGTVTTITNPKLKPEHGYSTDFGFVFNPSFYKPLSITVDYWHYTLKDGITSVTLPNALQLCFNSEVSGGPVSAYCGNNEVNGQPYFTRANFGSAGSPQTAIVNGSLPLLNSFSFYVTGWDYSTKLSYPKVHVGGMSLGNFETGFDLTYVDKYVLTTFDPTTGAVVSQNSVAGTFDPATIISMPRLKGLAYLFWSQGPWSATLEDRYTSNITSGDATRGGAAHPASLTGSGCYHANNGDGASCYRPGAASYVDISGSYTVKPINTTFTIGINDLFDDGIHQTFSGTYSGAPNPVYDVRGRNFYGKFSVRFK
jgi:outer membrane receptor protein involved in Fe transport